MDVGFVYLITETGKGLGTVGIVGGPGGARGLR
jgi:hypothetical protein